MTQAVFPHDMSRREADVVSQSWTSPAYQAYQLLRIGFTVAPILAGLDKFFHQLVNWDQYVAPWFNNMIGGHAHEFMMLVGVIEIVAGIGVWVAPRIFGYVVSAWLLCIIINLLTIPGYFDVALRDLGLAIGAFALARLSCDFHDTIGDRWMQR